MNLILLGPPGAGKGTQAVRIASDFGLVHLSSGDILRAERKARTGLGQKAQDYMDRGVLVPDDLILAMMMDHIGRLDETRGFLLDGFPRTVVQAEGLDRALSGKGRKIGCVVNLEVDDAEVVKRLTGRWYCPADGQVYHELYNPPAAAGRCNGCGGELLRRKDDEPAVVEQRLRTYHAETSPLIAYYHGRGVLKTVRGSASMDKVTESIKEACRRA